MPPESSYICKPGDKVAAIVKNSNSGSNPDSNTGGAEEESDEENWILAEVRNLFLEFIKSRTKYIFSQIIKIRFQYNIYKIFFLKIQF